MKIKLSTILVEDQDRALAFYAGVLGFRTKQDIPMGEARWLTVLSPEEPEGAELVLEPIGFGPARTYQKALFDAGIPLTSLQAADVERERERLVARGAVFRSGPTKVGPTTLAVFEDTCGNLIQIFQA